MARPDPDDTRTPVRLMIEEQLADPMAGWSMGVPGALAEFARRPGEPASRSSSAAVTARGGIRLELPVDVEVIAYETPTGPGDRWSHTVAFCLAAATARRDARTVVTELGPDDGALRPRDSPAVLFDLGLGVPSTDVCVRTVDLDLLDALRAAEGTALDAELSAVLVERSPHRVFRTECGRIEVYTPIPAPDGHSPDGPHTHLLPDLLRPDHTHPATAPIPEGVTTCLVLHPPHPALDAVGADTAFDAARHAAFQRLLDAFGDPVTGAIKAMTIAAVRAGIGPDLTLLPRDPPARAAVAVALRQLAHIDGPSPTLHAWRMRHPPEADLLHPDG